VHKLRFLATLEHLDGEIHGTKLGLIGKIEDWPDSGLGSRIQIDSGEGYRLRFEWSAICATDV